MLSSLSLNRTLRESSAMIEGIEKSKNDQIYFTCDSHALRLWSDTKQIKASHRTQNDLHLINITYMERLNCYMLIFSKQSLSNADGVIELWDSSLKRLCTKKIVCCSLSQCKVSPDETFLIISDDLSNLTIFSLDITYKTITSSGPWFPKLRDANDIANKKYQKREIQKPILELTIRQQLNAEEYGIEDVQLLDLLDPETLMIFANNSLLLFKRQERATLLRNDLGMNAENANGEVEEGKESGNKIEGPSYMDIAKSAFVRCHRFESFLSGLAPPCAVSVVRPGCTVMIIAFSDGNIGLYDCNTTLTAPLESDEVNADLRERVVPPSPMLYFQAHFPQQRSGVQPIQLVLCPWSTLPGDIYLVEFFTFGNDFNLAHWGIRRKQSAASVTVPESMRVQALSPGNLGSKYDKELFDVDVLGTYQFAIDPIPIEVPVCFKFRPLRPCIIPQQLPLVYTSSGDTMVRKILSCSVGGMLAVLDVTQPAFSLASNSSVTSYCLSGSVFVKEQCVCLLTKGVLSVFKGTNWSPIKKIALDIVSPITQENEANLNIGLVPSKSKISLKDAKPPKKDAIPCIIQFCFFTNHFICGYSNGEVCVVNQNSLQGTSCDDTTAPVNVELVSGIFFDTKEVHHSPICVITTVKCDFKHNAAWALIGDISGVISVWQITQSFNDKWKAHSHVWSTRAHNGVLLQIQNLELDSSLFKNSSELIFSGCDHGEIKAWNLDRQTGTMSIVAFINVKQKLSSCIFSLDIFDDAINVICLCGHINGTVSLWIFSEHSACDVDAPKCILPAHSSSVISFESVKNSYLGYEKSFISAGSDGSCCLLVVNSQYILELQHTYFMVGPTKGIVLLSQTALNSAELELIQFNEDSVTTFVVAGLSKSSTAVPLKWRYNSSQALSIPTTTRPGSSSAVRTAEKKHQSSTLNIGKYDFIRYVEPTKLLIDEVMEEEEVRSVGSTNTNILDIMAPISVHAIEPPTIMTTGESVINVKQSIDVGQHTPHTPRSVDSGSVGDLSRTLGSQLSLKYLKKLTMSEFAPDGQVFEESIATENIIKNDSLWNVTLSIQTELFLAKKDGYLLQLFVQNRMESKLPLEVVSIVSAVLIIDQWIAKIIENNPYGDNVTKQQVEDMFRILGVHSSDYLTFIQVAKIGAVISSIHKNHYNTSLFDERNRRNMPSSKSKNRFCKKFSSMRTNKVIVSYNSMGEKVIKETKLIKETVFGVPRGYADDIRKFWNEEAPRVPYHINAGIAPFPPALMKMIPNTFKGKLHKSVKVPKIWSSEMDHWFNMTRTVRIARTIMDMRFTAQQDFLVEHYPEHSTITLSNVQLHQNFNKVDYEKLSMCSLIVKYFERHYGAGDLHVAHQKVMHFLEALYQYNEHAIINCIRYFVLSEAEYGKNDRNVQSTISLFVESRSWLLFRGSIARDEYSAVDIDVEPSLGLSTSIGSTLESTCNHVLMFQSVRRSDALGCVYEMLRIRGCYGPRLIDDILASVDDLMSVSITNPTEQIPTNVDYIDLEQFLELFIFELKRLDEDLDSLANNIFDANQTETERVILPREVSPEGRPPSVDAVLSISSNYGNRLMTQVRDLMQYMMSYDGSREGYIERKYFLRAIMLSLAMKISDEDEYDADTDVIELMDEVKKRFCTKLASDDICYVDFTAILMSLIFQSSIFPPSLSQAWMLQAVMSVQRGVDQNLAQDLVIFLGRTKCFIQNKDDFWMCKKQVPGLLKALSVSKDGDFRLSTIDSSVLFTSQSNVAANSFYDGFWRCDYSTKPASDNPGSMTITKMLLQNKSLPESSLGVDGVEWRNQLKTSSVANSVVPQVMYTDRRLSTLHGESCCDASVSMASLSKAPLFAVDLTSSIETLDVNKSEVGYGSSIPYSRSQIIDGVRFEVASSEGSVDLDDMNSQFDMLDRYVNSPNRQEGGLEGDDLLNYRKDLSASIADFSNIKALRNELVTQERNRNVQAYINSHRKSEHVQSLSRTLSAFSFKSNEQSEVVDVMKLFSSSTKDEYGIEPGYELQCIQDSYDKYKEFLHEEEAVIKEIRDLELKNTLFQHHKHLEDQRRRKEQREKERLSLEFKMKADEARDERRDTAKKLAAKIAAEEAADKAAIEAAEQKRIQDRKLEKAAKEAERLEKIFLEEERLRSLADLLSMRNEEKYSIASEQHFNETARRIEKERREKLRLEEEERQARVIKELKAQEKRQKEEAEAAAKAEIERLREEKLLEKQNEDRELKNMNLEDVNVNPKEEVVVIEVEEVVEAPFVQLDEKPVTPPTKGAAVSGVNKLKALVKVLALSKSGSSKHPRRGNDKRYYIPQLFSDDIRFDPFATKVTHSDIPHDLAADERNEEDLVDPVTDFSDIVQKVNQHNVQVERKKMKQLYQINKPDIQPKDWTSVVRVDAVDWVYYFQEQLDRVQELNTFNEASTLDNKKKRYPGNAIEPLSRLVSKRVDHNTTYMTGGLGPSESAYEDDTTNSVVPRKKQEVIPLPFGKVNTNAINAGYEQFYQIEVHDKNSLTTVELRCQEGGEWADVYVAQGYFPSDIKYDYKATKDVTCCKHTIVFRRSDVAPQHDSIQDVTASEHQFDNVAFIIAVHYNSMSVFPSLNYSIWAMGTQIPPQSQSIKNASNTTKALNILAANSKDELWNNLPKLQRTAHATVQNKIRRMSNDASAALSSGSNPKLYGPMDDEEVEDMNSIEEFIAKAGRMRLKDVKYSASKSGSMRGDAALDENLSRLEVAVDPNLHEDLFSNPAVVRLDDEVRSIYEEMDSSSGLTRSANHSSLPLLSSLSFSKSAASGIGSTSLVTLPSIDTANFEELLNRGAALSEMSSTKNINDATLPFLLIPSLQNDLLKSSGYQKKKYRIDATPTVQRYTIRK